MVKKQAPAKKTPAKVKEEPFFRPFAKIAKKAQKELAPEPKALPKPPPPARPSAAAPSDAETFAVYMEGVREIGDGATRIPRSTNRLERGKKAEPPTTDLDAEARGRLRALVNEGHRFETVDDGERIEGRRLDVDPRDVRRLRRGSFAADAKLDLHGLTAFAARTAVQAFIKSRATQGEKMVIIVHGKGSHSPGGMGILRGEIAAWLADSSAARHVRAFATAPEAEGGTGAVLVLLAR